MSQTPPIEPVATPSKAIVEPSTTTVVTSEPGGNVDANPNVEDTFSNLEDDFSDTVSLSSSDFNYKYENGRRYHAYRAGQYLLPNDDQEQERLDIIHHIFSLTLRGDLCVTKLDHPQCILDVGTGTGIWAIEIGDMYPSAKVIGTDLSPIQPNRVPPNVLFEVDDATLEWTYPLESFDFIHARSLGGSILDWPRFIRRCYKNIKPGGKIEISDCRTKFFCDDDTWPADSCMRKWTNEFNRLSGKLGLKFDIMPAIPKMLADANFITVKCHDRIVPLGPWPKDKQLKRIGTCFEMQFLEMAIEAYTMALFTRNGWSKAATHVLLTYVRQEVKSRKMHIYTYCSYVIGTKPKIA